MLVFVVYTIMQANTSFILEGIHEMIFMCQNPCLQACYYSEFLCHVNMKCNFFPLNVIIFCTFQISKLRCLNQ
jgi:hypothetical protein